jgi:hypothetical protein
VMPLSVFSRPVIRAGNMTYEAQNARQGLARHVLSPKARKCRMI